jgi:UDP-N-acetylglucosamine 2-epimerase (non-hydrolysing)
LTGVLADLHLAATDGARDNLLREGTDPSSIVVTGNTVIDALHWAVERRAGYGSDEIEALDASGRPIVLVTAHRRESWGAPMESVGRALGELARRHPEVSFVFPIHRNPTVRAAIAPGIAGRENVLLTEPLEYGAFSRLMARSSLILTDSGGVQEEAPALGKPVLVLRETTERPEAVAAGCAVLVGTDEQRIVAEASALLADRGELARRSVMESPFGDGRAAVRCRDAIEALLAAR